MLLVVVACLSPSRNTVVRLDGVAAAPTLIIWSNFIEFRQPRVYAFKCNFCRTYFRCALDARISCISNVDIAEWMAFGMWNECISMHDQLSRNPRATIYIQFFRVWNLFEYFSLCFAIADLETFSNCINWIYERRHAIIVAPNSPTASSQSNTHHKWVSISVHCLRSSPRAHIFPVNFGMFVRK